MKTLDRRTMLRGVLGGAAVTIGLPALEALAQSTGFPKRFGIFFWGNGVLPEKWNPTGQGTTWTLSEQLAALEPVKSEISVVSGMAVLTGNTVPHGSGPAGMLSGAPMIERSAEDRTFSAPSIDQVIAAELGRETRFRSLELGARPSAGLSYNGPDSLNPPESSPARLFDRVFGGGFRLPGSDPIPDPRLRLRRSVLDAVMDDSRRLRDRLGATDKIRLEQHLDGVRELEGRIARLELNPPSLASCALPAQPPASIPDVAGRPQLGAIQRALSDVLAMALACDQTRVFSNFYTYPVNNVLFEGATAGHHQLTHDEPGDQPQVNAIVQSIIGELAAFLEALRRVPEGDGTLLDHSAILCTTDTSFGRTHSIDDYPIIIAGSAGGALKKGIHYRSPSGENASKVLLSLIRAMGLVRASFGVEGGFVEEGLGAIEA
jgi:hypothetical protein